MPLSRFDPANYPALLAEKVAQFRLAFAPFAIPEPEVFPSAPEHYRLRAEFRIWHHGDDLDYAMFDPENPKQPVMVEHFPLAAESICALMPRLLERLRASQTLRGGLFQADFLATLRLFTREVIPAMVPVGPLITSTCARCMGGICSGPSAPAWPP